MLEKRPASKSTMAVTLRVPNEAGARSACVAGEFNNWSTTETPMDADDHGFTAMVGLDPVAGPTGSGISSTANAGKTTGPPTATSTAVTIRSSTSPMAPTSSHSSAPRPPAPAKAGRARRAAKTATSA